MSDVVFTLDEAAQLGPLNTINTALNVGRGFGVSLHLIYQAVSQLKLCFPEGQDQTVLGNCGQVFFAGNDNATADYVSARIGDETVVVHSGGSSSGGSHQSASGPQSSGTRGRSWNTSENWQPQARRLLKPEEVIALPPRTAITLVPGVPPICTTLLRYYEEGWLSRRVGGGWMSLLTDLFVLVRTILWTAVFVALAAALTVAASDAQHARPSKSPGQAPASVRTNFNQ